MTFSLVARCPRTGHLGVAAITAQPLVGKLVTWAMADVGAVATHATTNPYYGIDGLALMERGQDAPSVLDRLLGNDPRRDIRQVGMIDRSGRATAWTGGKCPDWAGEIVGAHFATQGNRLTGPDVIQAIADTFVEREDLALPERLLVAMEAGHARGGDRHGERSGNVIVYTGEQYPYCDLRVDDADDPVVELHRLMQVYNAKLRPRLPDMPRRGEPAGNLMSG